MQILQRKKIGGYIYLVILLYIFLICPHQIPNTYIILSLIFLPERAVSFVKRKWGYFLFDFCYSANAAALVYFLCFRFNTAFQTWICVICEGPVSAAIFVWHCAYVPDSLSHIVSVMIHLLPGLALFCDRWYLSPNEPTTNFALKTGHENMPIWVKKLGDVPFTLKWCLVTPLLFYFTWQLTYWIAVQLLLRRHVKEGNFDTSFKSFKRRSMKQKGGGGKIGRFIFSGKVPLQIFKFGLVQLIFTLFWIAFGTLCCINYRLAYMWQIAKFAAPIYFHWTWTKKVDNPSTSLEMEDEKSHCIPDPIRGPHADFSSIPPSSSPSSSCRVIKIHASS